MAKKDTDEKEEVVRPKADLPETATVLDQGGATLVVTRNAVPTADHGENEGVEPNAVPVEEASTTDPISAFAVPTPVGGPISSTPIPNLSRDAELMRDENHPEVRKSRGTVEREPFRITEGTGPRTAEDLAFLIRSRPEWVNVLDQLDDLERAEGVKDPAPWVRNPVDLLEEAKRYNVVFIGGNGNIVV